MGISIDQGQSFGKTITVGSYELSPVSRQVELKSKRLPLRACWMTPSMVRVRYPNGEIEKIDIPDPTRRVQLGLLLGVFGMVVAWFAGRWIGSRRERAKR